MIPICDLKQQYLSLKTEIDAALCRAAESGHYILGPQVKAFEREIAAYCGCAHAAGVGNGTDALHLALRALRIGPGDEVITTPFTFVATTEAIGMVGATPVFVDIDPHTFNIDATKIEAAVTSRTKAILPVHLYGQPCDMTTIMDIADRRGLYVVEDCAQSLGAKHDGVTTGTIGDIGCLSFFPSKNLGAFGDGGMVVTRNPELFERVEMLRRHGGRVKYHHCELGMNSRLDELQAAVLRVKLPHLESWTENRRRIAARYNVLISSVAEIRLPQELRANGDCTPAGTEMNDLIRCVYHQFTIEVEDRERVRLAMEAAGVGTMVYYPVPLHLQEVHAELGYRVGDFPHAERAAERCLSLPMFPELTESQQDHVVRSLQAVLSTSQKSDLHRAVA